MLGASKESSKQQKNIFFPGSTDEIQGRATQAHVRGAQWHESAQIVCLGGKYGEEGETFAQLIIDTNSARICHTTTQHI